MGLLLLDSRSLHAAHELLPSLASAAVCLCLSLPSPHAPACARAVAAPVACATPALLACMSCCRLCALLSMPRAPPSVSASMARVMRTPFATPHSPFQPSSLLCVFSQSQPPLVLPPPTPPPFLRTVSPVCFAGSSPPLAGCGLRSRI